MEEYERVMNYDANSHSRVLLQAYGSVWPRVAPWCCVTSCIAIAVHCAFHGTGIASTWVSPASSTGHSFVSVLVSFLMVTRTSITYKRFLDCRAGLQTLFHTSRELVQYACACTMTNNGQEAVQWRQKVAFQSTLLLRVAIGAVEYKSSGVPSWQVLPETQDVAASVGLGAGDELLGRPIRNCQSGNSSLSTDNFRAPSMLAFVVRQTLLEPRSDPTVLPRQPLIIGEEIKLLQIVSDFCCVVEQLKKLVETPFSFPLEQMTRTLLLFWIFSLPLVLIRDDTSLWSAVVTMCLITFGYMGLEYVSLEFDDPFGNDPNDFPSQAWAEQVYEDACITVYRTDGHQAAMDLKTRIDAVLNLQASKPVLSSACHSERYGMRFDNLTVNSSYQALDATKVDIEDTTTLADP